MNRLIDIVVILALGLSAQAHAQGYNTGLPVPGLPNSTGVKTMAGSTSVTIASDQTPIPVSASFAPLKVKESRIHDASTTTINGSAGAWVELGGVALLTNIISEVSISANIGEPTQIGVGPNAGAVTQLFMANQGEGPSKFGVTLAIGDQLWIRSLSLSSINAGYTTVNLSN